MSYQELRATRLRTLLEVLSPGHAPGADAGLARSLAGVLDAGDASACWLALAVLRGELPDVVAVEQALRTARLDGGAAIVRAELATLERAADGGPLPRVRVLRDAITVDVHNTASATLMSGIQRVVRETVRRWAAAHELTMVGWTPGYRIPRPLYPTERDWMLADAAGAAAAAAAIDADGAGEAGEAARAGSGPDEVLVPWRGLHIVPELSAEPGRCNRLAALARYGGTELRVIGYDCIPVTSGSTVTPGMNSNFLQYLAAVRHARRVAAISSASAGEFRGWQRMIRPAGYTGPEVAEIELPVQAAPSSEESLCAARELLCLPGTPLVLVVGSHEPRKNHLAVLHAADVLWREGLRFNVVFVGSGSWKAGPFRTALERVQAAHRPVESITGLSDDLLWAAYRLARCVLFPSLNEGFGLPIAEALAAGTPVVTSGFGSMREIVAGGGGLLVDPRDDRSVTDAMRRIIVDETLHRRLRAEARRRTLGAWESYAAQTWEYLTARSA